MVAGHNDASVVPVREWTGLVVSLSCSVPVVAHNANALTLLVQY